jgi:predicted O-linked N-acetylglucosamine transferase (SPINDLY family)
MSKQIISSSVGRESPVQITQSFVEKINKIIKSEFTEQEKLDNVKNHRKLADLANEFISRSIDCKNPLKEFENRVLACECFNKIINSVDSTEYLLISSTPRVSRELYLSSLMNLGNYLKTIIEGLVAEKIQLLHQNNATRKVQIDLTLSPIEQAIFNKSLGSFIAILQVSFEDPDAIKQITSIYSQLTYFSQSNYEVCSKYLNESLMFDPTNPNIHYNLAHIYQRMNRLEVSLIHYKLSIGLSRPYDENGSLRQIGEESRRLVINCYNGLASIYRGIKKWPEAYYFLMKAHSILPEDPDINNQLGVTLTELRETEKADHHYQLAIKHYQQTFVSTDPKFLLAEVYLNYGHKFSYDGDNNKSIECYNQSLKVVPKFSLPFCNKLMNLCYIFDDLPDDNKMYIKDQHVLINKLYAKNPKPYTFDKNYFNTPKINIGIISGDFLDHPVSFFICTYLKNFDHTKFNLTCYSECIIDTSLFNDKIKFKIIKNMSQENASELIYKDRIHILLDLTGLTSFNRMDIFAFKPAPIQITYIGYPNTTGLYEMDYRIVDNITDGDDLSISQKFYTEKLIALKNCFLCYDPIGITRTPFTLPEITDTPRLKNTKELIIGNFNRTNKITDSVIIEYNKILLAHSNVKFLFKTKSLINLRIRKEFLNKFDKKVRNRIIILDCTLSHKQHLETYNQMDIAIDTFPYSGTTTTCEALTAGCATFSIYDSTWYFHAQNVSCSILKNSDLDFYVCNNTEEIIDKIQILLDKPIEFWKTQKEETRRKFLNGKFTNKDLYMKNIEKLFTDLFEKHRVI